MVSSSVVFGLSLLLLAQDVAAGNGIIGFGLSLYQDSCCLACHDSLASLYLNCTTFPEHDDMSGMDDGMDMEAMPMTSDECRTSNKPWLQSMAYCIKQACTPDGYTERRQAACFNTHALSGASGPSYHQSLPATAPTVELPEDATWLNATSLVNSHLYHTTHGTLDEFSRSEYIHTRYSVILYFIVIGTCLLWGLKTQLATLFPGASRPSSLTSKLRQYLYLPAFLGSRHLEPLPGNLGYMPSRALGASIGIYIILNIVFSSISFGSFQPNIYWPTMRVELCEYVGNRTGMLSLVNMSIAILFAGRNNILIAITGWSQTTFMTLHRWAARVATLQAIVHSAAYTLQYTDPGYEGATSYAKEVAEPFYWWGIIGTIALSLATAFAVLPLRISYYEFFLITHIVLIILSLVACWYHLVPHFGFKYGYQVWLYICFAFWSADRLARAVRVLYYNRLGNTKAIVEAIPGCNILHVTVFPRVTRGIGPGQHTFLYFPGLGKFWESHPFSIAAWQTQTHHTSSSSVQLTSSSSVSASEGGNTSGASKRDSLHHVKLTATPHHQEAIVTRDVQKPQNDASFQLLIRAHSGMTGALQRYLSAPSNADSKVEISVYTEGYYAGHNATLQPLYTADTVLCIVGGLGITHALGFVQDYANANSVAHEGETATKGRGVMRRAKRFVLAWSANEMAFIEHVKKNFLFKAQGVEVLLWCTGSSEDVMEKGSESLNKGEVGHISKGVDAAVTSGRMNIGSVIRSCIEVERQTTVLVCGPGQMADEARKQVVGCVRDGFNVDLIEEAFAW